MLETNGITISVDNDAVNYAKANTQGVIEIPNRIWNTLISNVTFPGRSFFNKLFINVSGVVEEEALTVQDKTIDITTNGTRTVTPDVGYQGLGEVTINTNVPSGVNNQNKSVVIRSNGSSVISPDMGYSGIGNLDLTVEVPSDINNQDKSLVVNSNGLKTIRPDLGYSGIGELSLSVNVPSDINNQNKSLVVNSNGFQQVLPDSGYSGIGELNLTVDVPQPVIQDNDIRYIVPSNEARQIIVEPGQGFDALEKVTLNIASATLVTNQNILNITSNGTFNLPSLENSQALGFADSCTVGVNVGSNKRIIDSFYVGYNSQPTGGSYNHVTVDISEFFSVDGNSFNASQQYGYIFVYELKSSGMITIGFVVPDDNNGVTFNEEVDKVYYYELGPAIYVRLLTYYDSGNLLGQVIGSKVVLGTQIYTRVKKEVISCSVFEE